MSRLLCPLTIAARHHAEVCAIDSPSERLTYAELDQRVGQLVGVLRQKRVGAGDRIGVFASPDVNVIIAFWALLRAGATVCPVDPQWPSAAIDQALQMADVDSIVTAREWSDWLKLRMPDSTAAQPEEWTVDASPATVIFSSGSTGTPKAIAHNLDAHLVSARGSNTNLPLSTGDAWLLSLPMFHVSGLGILFRCTLAGATVILPAANQSLVEQIEKRRPTHLSLVPTQLSRWLDDAAQPPDFLKAVLLGGGPLPNDLIQRAHVAGWPLFTTYGLSEMASQVTTTMHGAGADELQTVGCTLPDRELMIAEDHEILVRGATLFLGYVHGRRLNRPLDSNGWFHTGDLGRWDTAGRLVVIGRRDNLFISGGENIYPEEIEFALLELAGIHQAVVVPLPHREYGQRPVAFVDGNLGQVDGWRKALAERLPSYKVPDRFLPWPAVTGLKPNRRELQRLAEQAHGAR